jgi:diaminopimelate epimerase
VGWTIRTYERGVEAETLACGTGTIATALAGAGLAGLPMRLRSRSGSDYSVTAVLEGDQAADVWLCGEGRLVFTGDLVSPR